MHVPCPIEACTCPKETAHINKVRARGRFFSLGINVQENRTMIEKKRERKRVSFQVLSRGECQGYRDNNAVFFVARLGVILQIRPCLVPASKRVSELFGKKVRASYRKRYRHQSQDESELC